MGLFQPCPDSLPHTRSPPPVELRIDSLPRRKSRREGTPCTVASPHIDDRLQHEPAIVGQGSACPLCWREQGFQPAPPHVKQRWRLRRCSLLGHWWRRALPPAVVVLVVPGLVPTDDPGPVEDTHRG